MRPGRQAPSTQHLLHLAGLLLTAGLGTCAAFLSGCHASPAPRTPPISAPPQTAGNTPRSPESEDLAVQIASDLPEVKRYCKSLEQAEQPARCVLWSESPAQDEDLTGGPLRAVYLGESQSTHTVRFATLLVNLATRAVVAVDDGMCGRMTLAGWRDHAARMQSASPDDPPACPED